GDSRPGRDRRRPGRTPHRCRGTPPREPEPTPATRRRPPGTRHRSRPEPHGPARKPGTAAPATRQAEPAPAGYAVDPCPFPSPSLPCAPAANLGPRDLAIRVRAVPLHPTPIALVALLRSARVYVDRELGIRAARSDRHLDVIRVRGAPSDLPLRVLVILDNPEVHRLARLAVDDHRNVAGDTRRTVSEADVVLVRRVQ